MFWGMRAWNRPKEKGDKIWTKKTVESYFSYVRFKTLS